MREIKEKYPLKVILPLIGGPKISLDGDEVKVSSLRMVNFRKHGTICVKCGLKGIYFLKERTCHTESFHLNLYAEKDGEKVLMTRDHIVPTSGGGPDTLENSQTMCVDCNVKKGGIRVERKLATIQKVEEVLPIDGADSIEKIRIKGWWCVSRKEEFKPGDSCVYFEIDSLLPNIPQFEFLGHGRTLKKSLIGNGQEVEGYRLKTVKLRGQLSQGLAMPLSSFPEIGNLEIGQNVSQQLHVYKYDPPIPVHLAGEVKGVFPGFIPISDEERAQNCLELLEKYKGQRFYITSKIDGTSSTFYKRDNELGVCGHRLEFKETDKNIFWKLAHKYELKEKMPDGFAIQAETAGESVQSNRIKLKGVEAYVFYVFDINKWQYLKLDDMKAFVKELGMQTVPIINENFILNHTCDEILKMADAPSLLNLDALQEGIVFRLYDSLEKITFKAISNEYLLKHGL